MSGLNPDVIIPYTYDINDLLPHCVVYVRPKTNLVNYETAILTGIKPFGDVVYLANINAKVFTKDAIILDHYATQYKFAIYAREEIQKYPEMIAKIEKYFGTKFKEMNIIGSFDYIIEKKVPKDQLFNTIVPKENFLRFFGQTIKKIDNDFIVNYDIPEIINKYISPSANVFVVVIKLKSQDIPFTKINESIFNKLKANSTTPIIDEDKLCKVEWEGRVKRTYHISRGYISSIFDMLDFVYMPDGSQINLKQIPIAYDWYKKRVISLKRLNKLKRFNIAYVKTKNNPFLLNVIEDTRKYSMKECKRMLRRIIW